MPQRRVLEPEVTPTFNGGTLADGERDDVRRQMDRILANPLFKHSKRYPLLFRFVVEMALEGRASQLKERTLGVEVFGRDPDYDTNLDPVVRIAAGEIRKRIAQYYHEAGHEGELRIDLPCGSYLAEFHPRVLAKSGFELTPARASRWAWLASPSGRVAVSVGAGAVLAAVLAPALIGWRLFGGPLGR